MANERLKYLFERYRLGTCTPEERQELSILGLLPQNEAEIERLLETTWEQTSQAQDMPEEKGQFILENILQPSPSKSLPESTKILRFRWGRIAAAASIILILGAAVLFSVLTNNKNEHQTTDNRQLSNNINTPSINRATITLADGRTIYLDSVNNGQLALQGGTKLVKLADGQIAYQAGNGDIFTDIKHNTLTNPRGSKVIDMVLSDGSHIWLNAGSSVTYPVIFIGNERKISITGEAYFEVAHDELKPFIVSNGETNVQVLGTRFNTNAYDDENEIKVTLLEGSVKVNKGASSATIKPGQQARVNGEISVADDVNLEQVMAWKNGLFNLTGEDIKTIMRQISRWYDADIEYHGDVSNIEFYGSVSRRENVYELLSVMERTGIVHFKVEGKKIIVSK
jgi:ferric-dicitrate binding protein FerR (iron transport regulator)